jgi:hypothetical protein
MSRLEVPLQHRALRATGDTVLWDGNRDGDSY